MFYTGRGKKITFEQIPDALLDYYERNRHYDAPFSIIIGTDSQNFSDNRKETKIVTAICILCEGHGGIFFHTSDYIPLIYSIRAKLHTETARSLEIADRLLDGITGDEKYEELYISCRFRLNIDAGYEDSEFRQPRTHSKTEALIPELVSWVNAMGFEATVKPDSAAASSVADKLSK